MATSFTFGTPVSDGIFHRIAINRCGILCSISGQQDDIGRRPFMSVEVDLDMPLVKEAERNKLDDSNDAAFYSLPRITKHVDVKFLQDLQALYRLHLDEDTDILDLMSSYQSHLPPETTFKSVVGHGMNSKELDANSQLTSSFVQNLNANQSLAFKDGSFGAVLCALSVQYLQHPEKVFSEIHRVLSPTGVFIVSFSDHFFKEKATVWWLQRNMTERLTILKQFLRQAGFLQVSEVSYSPETREGDPFCAVIGRKVAALDLERAVPEPDSFQYRSFATDTLRDVSENPSERVLEVWVSAYKELQAEAVGLGIPFSATPRIREPITSESIMEARDHLRGIIESMLSSGL